MMDYQSLYSDKAKVIKPSGIRKFFDIVSRMPEAISLGVGEPDFDTPWKARRAGITAIEKGYTFYTSNWGLIELRREIAKYMSKRFALEYSPENEILVTVGGSEGIDNVLRAFISDGDEVLIPQPSFVCYTPLVTLAGGRPVLLPTAMEDEFRLKPEAIRAAITPKTKILILAYPSNPTGAVMTRGDYEEIAKILRGTNILVISDEIYTELTYGMEPVSFAQTEGMRERTVVINGFSKTFAMTGWRLGFALAPKELLEPVIKIHQFGIMSAPTMSQFAGIEALRDCLDETRSMREEYNVRRVYLVSELRRIGLPCFEPLGAFYVFPRVSGTGMTSEDFCERLLERKKLAIVPGSAFGDCGEGFVRISYSYSLNHLRTALKRMEEFLNEMK